LSNCFLPCLFLPNAGCSPNLQDRLQNSRGRTRLTRTDATDRRFQRPSAPIRVSELSPLIDLGARQVAEIASRTVCIGAAAHDNHFNGIIRFERFFGKGSAGSRSQFVHKRFGIRALCIGTIRVSHERFQLRVSYRIRCLRCDIHRRLRFPCGSGKNTGKTWLYGARK